MVNSFKVSDFKKNLKLFLNCVGKLYVVSVILRNAVTCLYGNLTSTYFDLLPPRLDDYFANVLEEAGFSDLSLVNLSVQCLSETWNLIHGIFLLIIHCIFFFFSHLLVYHFVFPEPEINVQHMLAPDLVLSSSSFTSVTY